MVSTASCMPALLPGTERVLIAPEQPTRFTSSGHFRHVCDIVVELMCSK
jgi:hypothetical protein